MSKVKHAARKRSYEYDHHYGLRSEVGTGSKPTRTKRKAKKPKRRQGN